MDLDTLKLERGLSGLKSRLRTVNAEMRANMSAFERGDRSVAAYETRLDGLNRKLEVQKRVVEAAKAEYEDMVREHGEGSEQAEKAARRYMNEVAALNNLERSVQRTTRQLAEMRRQQEIQSSGWHRLGSRLTNFGKGLSNISQKAVNVGKSLTRNITAPAAGAAAALASVTLVKGFDRLMGIDTARAKLKGLGHDVENIDNIMNSALESVRGTAFGLDEAATTAANAVAAGVKEGEELTRYLKLTGDAAAIAGAGMGEMGSILNKVTTAGKAYNGELQMLSDRGLPIYQWLAKEANTTADAVFDMASQGKISSEMLMNAIEKNIGGAAKTMGEESFRAALANIGADIARIGANFLDAGGEGEGFFSTVKPMLTDFRGLLQSLEPHAAELGTKFGQAFKGFVDRLKEAKQWFDNLSPSVKDMIVRIVGFGSLAVVAIGPLLTALGLLGGFIGNISSGLGTLFKFIAKGGGLVKVLGGAFSFLTNPIGLTIGLVTLLTTGFIYLYKNSETFRNGLKTLGSSLKDLGSGAFRIFKNAVAEVFGFLKEQFVVLKQFWKENSETIKKALSNILSAVKFVFQKGILPVIKFVMPFILNLIKSVWENIKGIITGALNIIMGAVKIFSGLFTGNFSKMWEGVKQLFRGAIQFVWNFIQLHFIGQILKGIGGFATNLVSKLKGGWDKAINGIRSFVNKAKEWFTDLLKNGKQKFDDLVDAAKKLPKRIGDGIKNMAGKVTDGVKAVANKMTEMLGKGINGVIGGVNWVLGKIGVKNTVPKWTVPQYAQGTNAHPGGLAVVGDGKGSNAGSELIQTPDGKKYLSPNTPTLVNLPKGTQVLSAKHTKELFSLPHYAKGTGILSRAWESTKKVVTKVKDSALDVWSYISNPGKLFNKALELFGVETPKFPGMLKDLGKGLFNKAKDALKTYLKNQLDVFQFSFDASGEDWDSVGPKGGFGGLLPSVERIYRMVEKRFGKTWFMGGYVNRNVRGRSTKSMHAYGRAFDIGGSFQTMSKIAEFLRRIPNAQHIIFNRRISSHGGPWRKYTGVNPHTDHVHADFKKPNSRVDTKGLGHGGFGANVDRWAGVARQALVMTGQYTAANLRRLLYQMKTESGGNPRAINLWDSNARRGTPSKGLMQVIDPTFRRYAMPGYNKNIWDPLSNILASIRYALERYGSLARAYRGVGYKTGGIVNVPGLYHLAEEGYPEFVIPTAPHRRTEAMKLLAFAARSIQGNKRPNQIPNVSTEGNNQYYDKVIEKLTQQVQLLTELVISNREIANKPVLTEGDIARAYNRYDAIEASKHRIFSGRGGL